MASTVQKWGNSLGIRIPKSIAEQVDLKNGTEIEFQTDGGVLTVRPRRKLRRKCKLADLLAQMKPKHRHGELFKGGPKGRELI